MKMRIECVRNNTNNNIKFALVLGGLITVGTDGQSSRIKAWNR
jgi:hypothetical protein